MNNIGAGIAIIGCGSTAPQNKLTNEHLSGMVETSDEWIRERTGISKRHAGERRTPHQLIARFMVISAVDAALEIFASDFKRLARGQVRIEGLQGALRVVEAGERLLVRRLVAAAALPVADDPGGPVDVGENLGSPQTPPTATGEGPTASGAS